MEPGQNGFWNQGRQGKPAKSAEPAKMNKFSGGAKPW
jgi:hypothetical protein